MKKIIAAGLASGVFLVAGCSGSHGYGSPIGQADTTSFAGSGPAPQATSTALFKVLSGVLPYPFDVYFAGSTAGTLKLPLAASLYPSVTTAVNALDGFSTTGVIRERFAGPLDAASLAAAGAVVMVHINTLNAGPHAKAPVSPLQGGAFTVLKGCLKGSSGCLPVALTGPCSPAGCDYAVGVAADDASILEITPLKPLAASTCLPTPPATSSPCQVPPNFGIGEGYMVLLTKLITVAGVAAVADADYASFQAALAGGPTCPSITNADLNAVCQLTGAHLALGQALGINPANVVASFSFSTESTLDTLAAAASEATPRAILSNQVFLAPGMPATTAAFQGKGFADVYVGVLTLPYYLSTTEPGIDTGFWNASAASAPDKTSTFTTRFNPFPIPTVKALQIPVLMTVPNATSGTSQPATGWPVTIFQHGLTANRTNLFGIADSLALGGMVGIAIDLPLHGLTVPYNAADPSTYFYASSSNPWYAGLGLPATGSIERTFDLDTINKAAGVPGLDSSGSHWFTAIASPLTVRDLLRESSVDLVTLAESVASVTLPAPATAPYIDSTRIHYMGHSQGAIEGPGFLAVMAPNPVINLQTATLASPGGQYLYLALESPTFGPQLIAGLEKQSNGLLTPGTTLFANYERDFQSVLDSGDPWNFIALAAELHPIHIIQVVGSTPPPAGCNPETPPDGCPDQVVPNDSTARLLSAGGFAQAHYPGVAGATALHVFVNFTEGVHASFLDPTYNLAVTEEEQLEAVTFTGQAIPALGIAPTTPGTSLLIANPTVVQ
jgi:hypothetical protein